MISDPSIRSASHEHCSAAKPEIFRSNNKVVELKSETRSAFHQHVRYEFMEHRLKELEICTFSVSTRSLTWALIAAFSRKFARLSEAIKLDLTDP